MMEKSRFTYSDAEMKQLVLRCYARFIAYIKHILHCDKAHAEDVLSEAIEKFLTKRAPVSSGKAEGYLFCIVRNNCYNILSRSPRVISLESCREDSSWELLYAIDFADAEIEDRPAPSVSELLDFSDTLPGRTREIFQQSRIEGRSNSEIAEELGVSIRAVEQHLQKSVTIYRDKFKKLS